MFYYLDESGNWQEIEKEQNRLVITSLVISDEMTDRQLKEDIEIFKAQRGLKDLHAADMRKEIKEEFYTLIETYVVKDEVKVLSYLLDPGVLYSETMRDSDDIYTDIASRLIGESCLGDTDVKIEYDMKFHYAYPFNVIQVMKHNNYDDFIRMQKNFFLTNQAFDKQKRRIKTILSRVTSMSINSQQLKDKSWVSRYLWSEFRLKVEKAFLRREILKERTRNYIKQTVLNFEMQMYDYDLSIEYKGKHAQSAGVQMVDMLCNLLWIHGHVPKNSASSTVKSIYHHITIKDITNEV